ncbi:MAG TPA: DUF6263 family protein [Gemmataceae bacterium]|nr:DUF6263 family protein [Gemmataceae bacterium]
MRSCSSQLGWCVVAVGALVLGSAVPVCAADSGGVTLRYKFKQGETLPYQLQQKMDMTMSVGGQEIPMKMDMAMDIDWKVQDVKDGSADVSQTVKHVHFTMDGGGPIGKVEYDSKTNKEPEGPVGKAMAPLFNSMVGGAFTFTMSPEGTVSNFKAPEKFTEAVKNAPGGGGGMFSPDQFKQMVQQSIPLPKEPVAKGKKWDQKLNVKLGPVGTMTGKNIMTYEGSTEEHGKELQKIAFKPEVKLTPAEGSPIKFELKKQDAKGTMLFDNKAGHIVQTNLTQTMELAASIGGQDMTQKIKQTVSMKLAGSGNK